jgi:hypothetical protein
MEFSMFPRRLFESAAGISNMWSLAAFAMAVLASYLNGRRQKPSTIVWAIVAAVVLLGLTPTIGSLYVLLSLPETRFLLCRLHLALDIDRLLDDASGPAFPARLLA